VDKYWSERLKTLEPYTPGEQPRDRKIIKLNTNENPYPPSPKVIEALKKASDESLRLYPDPTCDSLRSVIAAYHGLDKQQVFVGNGSDEILAFSFMAFFDPGEAIVFPDITYSFYEVYSSLFNINYTTVPVDENFRIPVDSFPENSGGVIIANPNAPTGRYLPLEDIQRLLDRNRDSVVIIDEAYIDFGGDSAVGLVKDYPNLLIIRTLSKSRSLAGLRVGYAMGNPGLIEGLDRIKNSFNSYTLDRLALEGAKAAFEDEAHFNDTRLKVINTRERISAQLKTFGFTVIESKANFIFISHPQVHASEIFGKLREEGIIVRYFNKPRIDNYLRVTIGTDQEMDVFLQAVKGIVGRY